MANYFDQFDAPRPTAPNYFDQFDAPTAQQAESPWYSQLGQAADDTVRLIANGLTAGYADKLAGAMSGTGTDAERAMSDDARERAGLAGTVAELGGAVALPVSAGKAGVTLAGRLGTGAMTGLSGLAARTGLMGVEGAGYGALSASGHDEDMSDGARMGAIFGTGGNLIGEGVHSVLNMFRGASTRGAELATRAAEMDGLTPDAAAARLKELGPDATLADLGPNMRAQASALATTPGPAQKAVRDVIGSRAMSAGDRITQAVDAGLGPQTNTASLADDMVNMRSANARPLYDAAYAKPMPVDDEIVALFERPAVADAFGKAQRMAANAGQSFDAANPSVQALDYTKRALDDMIVSAQRSGNNNEARILSQARDSLLSRVDEAVPEFAAARKSFAGASSVIDALDEGGNVFKNATSPDQLRAYMSGLDDSSREAFTQGARQQVSYIMGTARNDAQAAKALFARGYNREKLEAVLGPEEAQRLLGAIDAEEVFASTRNAVMGGSDTAAKARAADLIAGARGNDGFIRNLANLRFGDAGLQVADSLIGSRLANRAAATNDELARIIMSQDVTKIAPILAQRPEIADDIMRAIMGGSIAIGHSQ